MHLIFERKTAVNTLLPLQALVDKNAPIPILQNVKIEAENGKVILTTTDMDIAIRSVLHAEVLSPGKVTVPVCMLYDIVRKLPEGAQISAKLSAEEVAGKEAADKHVLYIQVQGGHLENDAPGADMGIGVFTLPCMAVEEFPDFQVAKATHEFMVGSAILRKLFEKTKHAISKEETRYYLTGAYFHIVKGIDGTPLLRVVATDMHRLSLAEAKMKGDVEKLVEIPGIIVPKKTVSELIAVLSGYEGEVKVEVSPYKVVFYVGDTILMSRLIDAKFPDYTRVIPANEGTVEVSRKELERCVDLVVSVSEDKTRAVRLKVDNSHLELFANSTFNGNATGKQQIKAICNTEPITLSFNSKYILDSLSAIDSDTLELKLPMQQGPIIAQEKLTAEEIAKKAKDNENEPTCSSIHVLMPMKVK
jgi:DNA polymerase-3 subunit beta